MVLVNLYTIKGLLYGQMVPLLLFTVLTLVIAEASGAATDKMMYPLLKGTNEDQVCYK